MKRMMVRKRFVGAVVGAASMIGGAQAAVIYATDFGHASGLAWGGQDYMAGVGATPPDASAAGALRTAERPVNDYVRIGMQASQILSAAPRASHFKVLPKAARTRFEHTYFAPRVNALDPIVPGRGLWSETHHAFAVTSRPEHVGYAIGILIWGEQAGLGPRTPINLDPSISSGDDMLEAPLPAGWALFGTAAIIAGFVRRRKQRIAA